VLLLCAAVAACADERDPSSTGVSITGVGTGVGMGGDGIGVDDSGDGDDGDDTSGVLDLSGGSEGGPLPSQGCSGIDFLFVVDDSASMAAQQARLLSSFDGFIAAIQNTIVDVTSYHVGVVTSDAYAWNETGCRGLGDLVTVTGGADASGASCGPFAEGGRFASDQDDLSQKFPCIARVGTEGSAVELPVSAAIAALHPGKAEPGGCNEAFLRDDAILVVVIVTDDPPFEGDMDDAHPDALTAGWHDAIVDAKHGDEAATVVIGFVPWQDLSCLVYEVDSPNLVGFVESFGDRGVLASVCDPDYTSIFASTVATIQTTCQEFTPAG
jgi:hypothetical protein